MFETKMTAKEKFDYLGYSFDKKFLVRIEVKSLCYIDSYDTIEEAKKWGLAMLDGHLYSFVKATILDNETKVEIAKIEFEDEDWFLLATEIIVNSYDENSDENDADLSRDIYYFDNDTNLKELVRYFSKKLKVAQKYFEVGFEWETDKIKFNRTVTKILGETVYCNKNNIVYEIFIDGKNL